MKLIYIFMQYRCNTELFQPGFHHFYLTLNIIRRLCNVLNFDDTTKYGIKQYLIQTSCRSTSFKSELSKKVNIVTTPLRTDSFFNQLSSLNRIYIARSISSSSGTLSAVAYVHCPCYYIHNILALSDIETKYYLINQ